jgi:probable F420-dependent oxidoreductase
MKFGIEIPTCTAGMMHPVPFADAAQVVDTALEAEQLGYHDAGGNDHLSTMRFVREAWPAPPDYFEPLVTLAHVAAKTSVLRLATGIMVLPMREPVLLAKQVATLDQLSGGRVMLGVAVGGYRDEFEGVRPELASANRAELTRETIESVRAIWEQPRASYRGKYVHFEDVESYPKPVQDPLPIYSGGNVEGSFRRAGELCQGWLPAKVGPAKIAEGRAKVAEYARAAGRDPGDIATALQSVVCLGNTPEQARETFLNSSFDLFRRSLQATMTKGVDVDAYLDMNLVGTPDQVCEKVDAFARAGLEHLTALLFVGNTVEEMREQIRTFARHVLPAFPEPEAAR